MMIEKIKDRIDDIRWKYFTNLKSGYVYQAVQNEIDEVMEINKTRFVMYERIGQYYLRDITGELLTLQFARESDCNEWMGFVNGVRNDFSFTCEVSDTCTITEDNMKLPMLLFNSQEDYQKWVNFIVDRIW